MDVFDDAARMATLRAAARAQLASVDLLLVPTALEHYLVAEVQAEEGASPPTWPKNAKNGRFTNFVSSGWCLAALRCVALRSACCLRLLLTACLLPSRMRAHAPPHAHSRTLANAHKHTHSHNTHTCKHTTARPPRR